MKKERINTLEIIRKHILHIVGWMIVSLFAGFFYARNIPDSYSSTATLMVSSEGKSSVKNLTDEELQFNQRLATTYINLGKSSEMLDAVIKRLDLSMGSDELAQKIEITRVPETEFIRVTSTDSEAVMAVRITSAVAEEFIDVVKEIMNFKNVRVVEEASLPEKAQQKKIFLILMAFLSLGAVISTISVFIFETFFSKVKKPEEIENLLKSEILIDIPLCDNSIRENLISENFKFLRTDIHFIEKNRKDVVVVTSTIPGEGKTSVAYNYGKAEAEAGRKVLIIDCDIRRPRMHKNFGIEHEKGLVSLLKSEITLSEAIVKDVEIGLDIIPAEKIVENVTEILMEEKFLQYIKILREDYELIILDTAPITVATDALVLSEYADGVIYVVGYDMVSENELKDAHKLIEKLAVNLYGIVVNRVTKEGYDFGYYNDLHRYFAEYERE
ncbi:MAG: polysaccharide biosynthesis tyrosine autokinase [Fusobacteriaceae bacterium]